MQLPAEPAAGRQEKAVLYVSAGLVAGYVDPYEFLVFPYGSVGFQVQRKTHEQKRDPVGVRDSVIQSRGLLRFYERGVHVEINLQGASVAPQTYDLYYDQYNHKK